MKALRPRSGANLDKNGFGGYPMALPKPGADGAG